jgi:MFS family permease
MQRSFAPELPATPRYYYGWNIVALSILASLFSVGVVFYTHGVFRFYLIRDFGFTEGDTLRVYSYYIGAVAFHSFFFTPRLIEKLGSRRTMMLGSVILAAGLFVLGYVPSKSAFFVVFALVVSLGVNCMGSIPSQAALAYWFEGRRGQALSIAATGVTAGGIVNIPFATWLLQTYGWRIAYQVFAGIVLVVGVGVIGLFFRDRPQEVGLSGEPRAAESPPAGPVPNAARQDPPLLSYRQLLTNGVFLRLAASMGLASTGWAIILQSLVADFHEQGYSAALSTLYMTGLTWVILIGKPFFGTVTTRLDRKGAMILACSLQLAAIALFLLSRFIHPLGWPLAGGQVDAALILGLIFYGIGAGGTQPLYTAYQADLLGRKNFARAAGVAVPIITFVQLTGYRINAILLDRTGSHLWMWIVMSAFYSGALLLLAFLPRADSVQGGGAFAFVAADTAPASIAGSLAEASRHTESERE